MKKNIAIVAGGDSSEIVVSLKSAEGIRSFIDNDKYNVYIAIVKKDEWSVQLENGGKAPIDKNDFSFRKEGETVRFDFAYITIHGTPGENGLLQGYFEIIGLPYSCCNVLAAALTFDKNVCKNYLKGFGVRVADSMYVRRGERVAAAEVVSRLGLPLFVKPNADGSSFGVTKVKEASKLGEALEKAFGEGSDVLIERFLAGTEVTCGCYKVKDKSVVLPLTEVVTDNEFFDYDAKYNGQVSEITPARISGESTAKIQALTSRIYDILGAKGIIRVDYIIDADGEPYMLEVNTTPGMTATSFIPQQVRAAGMEMKEVMDDIIENEIND